MSVKLNKSQSLLKQRLQGMMESKDIPKGDVEALVQNPAELKKLLVESGDKFDSTTKAAAQAVIGGDDAQVWNAPASKASSGLGPQALLMKEKSGSQEQQSWFQTGDLPDLMPKLFDDIQASAVKVGDVDFSQADLEEMLRGAVSMQNKQAPFVDVGQVLQIAKGE